MNKKWNAAFSSTALMAGLLGISTMSLAEVPTFHEHYGVAGWEELVPNVQQEYQRYRQQTLQDSSLSEMVKIKNIGDKYDEIRRALTYNRKSVYASFSEQYHVSNSVVKEGGWGTATAAPECLSPTKAELYTIPEWVKGGYQESSAIVDYKDVLKHGIAVDAQQLMKDQGKVLCTAALTQKQKGRSVAYSEASFRISPQHINHMVSTEVTHIMQQITQVKDHS